MSETAVGKRFVKRRLIRPLSRLFHRSLRIVDRGAEHYCPVCESGVRRFHPFGEPARPYALCPICGSLERHRLDWIVMTQRTSLLDDESLLHVAPEPCLSRRFEAMTGLEYTTVDIDGSRAMIAMDITDIDFPEDTFSAIYCSHVLEHIPNDHDAIAELYRVLRPGGWALLQVPVAAGSTFEDPSIMDPEERRKQFGQRSHVRRCGPDYVNRFMAAGFRAESLQAADLLTEADCIRLGIQPARWIFLCTKPQPQGNA